MLPVAVVEVRQIVQVLQVKPVRGEQQAGLFGAQEALVRGRAGLGQVPALEVDPG